MQLTADQLILIGFVTTVLAQVVTVILMVLAKGLPLKTTQQRLVSLFQVLSFKHLPLFIF
jgi:hypothetical protein